MPFKETPSHTRSFGTTVKPRRTPVNPAFFEKLRISIAQVFANVLMVYASSGSLLSVVEFLPTNYTTSATYTPMRDWYNEVLNAAVTVADYVEKNKKLPTSVTILGNTVNMSQFAVLELKVVIGLSQGKSNENLCGSAHLQHSLSQKCSEDG